jgi:hypothetical protein
MADKPKVTGTKLPEVEFCPRPKESSAFLRRAAIGGFEFSGETLTCRQVCH